MLALFRFELDVEDLFVLQNNIQLEFKFRDSSNISFH